MREDLNKFHFNQQMIPNIFTCLLSKPELLTETQKNCQYYKTGKLRSVFNVNNNYKNNIWSISIINNMHGIITSMICSW